MLRTPLRESLEMNFSNLDAKLPEIVDQVIEQVKRFNFFVFVDQEKASPGALFEEHNPFLGVGWVGNNMGIENHPFGMFGFYIFALHGNSQTAASG
jgi:hypothetical protein